MLVCRESHCESLWKRLDQEHDKVKAFQKTMTVIWIQEDDDDDESFLEGIRIRDDVLIAGRINM